MCRYIWKIRRIFRTRNVSPIKYMRTIFKKRFFWQAACIFSLPRWVPNSNEAVHSILFCPPSARSFLRRLLESSRIVKNESLFLPQIEREQKILPFVVVKIHRRVMYDNAPHKPIENCVCIYIGNSLRETTKILFYLPYVKNPPYRWGRC